MRALGIAFLVLTLGSCSKKDEAPTDTGAQLQIPMDTTTGAALGKPMPMDTAMGGETGGIPKITDTTRIPSDEDSLRDSLKKRL